MGGDDIAPCRWGQFGMLRQSRALIAANQTVFRRPEGIGISGGLSDPRMDWRKPWPDGPMTSRAPCSVAVVIARTVGVTWKSWPRFEGRSATRNDSETARQR
jgi:hypothetical protein